MPPRRSRPKNFRHALDQLFRPPHYRGPRSDHFDGERFFNPGPRSAQGLGRFLRWRWARFRGRLSGEFIEWRWQDAEPGPPPPRRVEGDALRVTLVNHSTVLLQTAGLNVLTDPVWSKRASPVQWVGPPRFRPPGLRFDDLPPIDVVLLSHNHYDHLDLPALDRLARAHRPLILTTLGVGALLHRHGIGDPIVNGPSPIGSEVRELDWWQTAAVAPGVEAVCLPAVHFSGRGLRDRDATLWCGFGLRFPHSPRAGSLYFAGDTAFGPHFSTIADCLAPIRLALLPIGGFAPRWFMGPVHQSPQQAVEAHRLLHAALSLAIHDGTFQLADDAPGQARRELVEALEQDPAARQTFLIPTEGEGIDVPPAVGL